MNKTKLNRANVMIVLLAAGAVLGSSLIALSFERESSNRETLAAVSSLPVALNGPGFLTANQSIEVEVVTATPAGFEPATITRARGPFILALHNRSGEKELVLRIFRLSGEQLQEMRLRTGSRRQPQRLDLPAGEYVIAEASHPAWRCQLVITR